MDEEKVQDQENEVAQENEQTELAPPAEFNLKVAEVMKEYSTKVPLIFMIKILNNLATDLIYQALVFHTQNAAETLKNELENKNTSRLII